MRKLLLWVVLPFVVLMGVGLLILKPYLARGGPSSDWSDSLRAAAAKADHVVVHDLNFHGDGPQADCEIRGADKIRQLFAAIDIDSTGSGFHCMCDGEYWIHVYQGDKELFILGYHHGRSLRWHHGSWKGDGLLTAASQEALPAWFQKNGCAYLQQLRDRELARRKKEQNDDQRFASFFPENVRRHLQERSGQSPLDNEDEVQGRKIAEIMNDGEAVAVSACRALGTSDMTWTSTTEKERRALAAVHTVTGEQFLAALQKLRNDKEPAGLRGAGRVFFREEYSKKVPAEARIEWTIRLAESTLTHGLDGDKPYLLSLLEKEHDPKIKKLLQDVFRGKVGNEIDREKAFGQEPGLRTGAALALVLGGDESIKPEIERLLPQLKAKSDIAALEVCLALLGDPSYIKAQHFKLESYNIGLAGLKAIEKYKGKHGMEALVKGGIHHPWFYVHSQALITFERITGQKMSAGEIEDWWEVEHEGKRDRPQPILTIKGNSDQLRCVAFSPDGTLVASGSNDFTAKVWNAETGAKLFTLRGHEFTVLSVAFHPSGKQLATASGDKQIKIWDLVSGKEIRTLAGHSNFVNRIAYSPDGKVLASASEQEKEIRIWDAATGKLLSTFAGHTSGVECLAFRPDNQRIASADYGQNILIWNPANGEIERSFKTVARRAKSIAWSPDGKQVATGEADSKTVRAWNAQTGELLHTYRGHTDWVDAVAFSPDGKWIASTGWDLTVRIWDRASGKERMNFKAHPEWVNDLAFRPDGKRLATTSEDKSVRVWDLDKLLEKQK